MPRLVVVTGAVGAGKSTLLAELAAHARKHWMVSGCLARGDGRVEADAPASCYWLDPAGGGEAPLWAERLPQGGYQFHEQALGPLLERVRGDVAAGAELVFLDEIGKLELAGQGLAPLLRELMDSPVPLLVLAVRRELLADLSPCFALEHAWVLDLELMTRTQARRVALREIRSLDAERIGLFAGLGGLVEVGLGSVLHAWRVPLKGHFLAYLQAFTLATFGKALHGRGLVRITFIESLLKAFSPMGSRLMPMLYILIQGATFALPVAVLGWNLPAMLLGSVLMAWLTLGLWLAMKTILFGQSFWLGMEGLVATVSGWMGAQWTLRQGILWVFGLKALLALLVGLVAWRVDGLALLRRHLPRRKALSMTPAAVDAPLASWPQRARGALRDVLRRGFLLAFLLSILLILFFARLGPADLATVALRGLCLAYVGFLLLRSLDAQALARWLDRRAGLDMAASLPSALKVLQKTATDDEARR